MDLDLEVTIQACWLVSALKDTKVYHSLKSTGLSGQAALIETRPTVSGSADTPQPAVDTHIAMTLGFLEEIKRNSTNIR